MEVSIDSAILENCFEDQNSINALQYTPTIEYEIENTNKYDSEAIKDVIEFNLPFLEREVIKRIYFDEIKQEGIAKLYGISQEMVSYYKARGEKRIEYFMKTKKIGIQDLIDDLKDIVTSKQLEALVLYYKYHNQNMIAGQCSVTQSAISTRIKLGLKQLMIAAQKKPSLMKYCEIFRFLSIYNSLQGYKNKPNKSQMMLDLAQQRQRKEANV